MTILDAIIVGAGFSGIGASIALSNAGHTRHIVLEKARFVGGTWRENTYPGCACDVPSALYSFTYAPYPDWDRVFARQPQIRRYLQHVADTHHVTPNIRFGAKLQHARWLPDQAAWRVQTPAEQLYARTLILAAGPLHLPRLPQIPGRDTFSGTAFHSARWNHPHNLRGRTVAVVGTGASAIQFVPRIQPQVARLKVFQRTAPWVLPKPDRGIPRWMKAMFRHLPVTQRSLRGALYAGLELLQLAQRKPVVMQQIQRIGRAHLRRQVHNPELRRSLAPEFTLGCKRLLLSNAWYPALCAHNTELVPHAVREITPTGLIDATGREHHADTIIYATGFTVTRPPISKHVVGTAGVTLDAHWAGSPKGYIGTTVAGFPNLFTMIGPNLGNGHTSATVLIEAQADYIADTLSYLKQSGNHCFEPRADLQNSYNAAVQRALAGTVWNAGGCSSFYLDEHGKNSTIYPWTTIDLRRRLARFRPEDFEMSVRTQARYDSDQQETA